MRGTISSHSILGRKCSIYLPPDYVSGKGSFPVAYLLGESNITPIMNSVESRMEDPARRKSGCRQFILFALEATDWERDFSPWRDKEPPAQTKFTGGAGAFLSTLKSKIIPQINSAYRTVRDAQDTVLAGYSLAGLAALYGMFTQDFAMRIASVSGSLWYPKWTDWAATQSLPAATSAGASYRVYMSLGRDEKTTNNPLMATVETCTEKTYRIIQSKLDQLGQNSGDNLFFEYNPGNHFTDVAERTAKALVFLES